MSEIKSNTSISLLGDDVDDEGLFSRDHSKSFLSSGMLPSYTRDMPLITTGVESKVNRSIGSFSMSPPPLSMSPPSLSTVDSNSPLSPLALHTNETKDKTAEVITTKSLWKVTNASVPTLPECYPLERTSVFIPHTSASVVASRVTEILSERCINCKFSDEKAKIKCITSYNVDFRVRLYKGKGEFSHGIIIEVQRRFGFSPHFHADTQAILDAAEGKTEISQGLPHPFVADNDLSDSAPLPSLDLISRLISSNKYDSQVLAINGLAALTDCDEIGQAKADYTIKSLSLKEYEVLRSYVFSIVRTGYLEENKPAESSVMKQDAVLEKAMILVARLMLQTDTTTCDHLKSLTPMLLSSLKNASHDTKLALHSASIILKMLKSSYDHSLPKRSEILNVMINTRSIGEAQNKHLLELSNRCIELMT